MKSIYTLLLLTLLVLLTAAYPYADSTGKTCCLSSGTKGLCRPVSSGCPGGTFESNADATWPCHGDSIQCCVFTAPPSSSIPSVSNGRMGQAGINLLLVMEGVELQQYADQRGVSTIGVGRNCETGHSACPDEISYDQAMEFLTEDLRRFEAMICTLPNAAELNTNQFDAMVSYAFNVGEFGAFDDFWPYMNARDFAGIADNIENMRPIDGRRRAEKELFMAPTAVLSGCPEGGVQVDNW